MAVRLAPIAPKLIALCMTCGNQIEFNPGAGWVHSTGGGLYTMRCERCGWRGSPHPSPVSCPGCGQADGLRDDHCATAEAS